MKNLFIALLGLLTGSSFAQLSITPTDASTAVNTLIGNNTSSIQIIGTPTFSGNSNQLGTFSFTGSVIGMNSGIFIGTNGYDLITGGNSSNNSNGIGSDSPNPSTNADLTSLLSQYYSTLPAPQPSPPSTFHNLACLEFKAKILSSSAKFTFVFASEEYSSYVASPFNDIFAFLVSGPGINGNINGFANIALVPGTSTPIMVSTVNDGYTGVPTSNSQYFKNNTLLSEYPSPPNSPCCISTFQMDGFTINPFSGSGNLEAEINNLECGAEYTFKFYIANVSDNMLISSVFLKEGSFVGSFSAGPVAANPQPACEGNPLVLFCGGNSSYTYNWSSSSGVTLGNTQTITIPAQSSLVPIYVEVTDPTSGCSSIIESIPLIHILDNQPPYSMGINDLGVYELTINANEQACIQLNSYDNIFESVDVSPSNLPSGVTFNNYNNSLPNGSYHQYVVLCWTPQITDIGKHCFKVNLEDNNKCDDPDRSNSTETFCINVICPDCTPDVFYQNRTVSNNPVPLLTESAGFIAAGSDVIPFEPNGPVEISDNTIFRASSYIYLNDGFSTDGFTEFVAEIIDTPCNDDCIACCKDPDNDGITITLQNIPNIFSPDPPNGFNDVWYITDTQNEFCAFGALYFDLIIYDNWGVVVRSQSGGDGSCCKFKAPGPNNNIPYSSIFWNGKMNNTGNYCSSGVYFYVLTLKGCNNQIIEFTGNITLTN